MDVPARIGKYELLQFLGGGMSHVYRATDTVLRRTVAVKVLTEQGCADRESKARFLQEAITAGNIQHENIIKVYDYGEENNRPFIVMEFLTGEDLRDAIRNGHTGDFRNRVRIALAVARALAHVHEKKIIHRDIKPENIHIDTNGHVRLMDFGIAKSEGFSMTKTGFALGTPYYMAPEQVLGHPATERVDVYAFGILMYELMTGIKPFTGDSVERLFFMILNEPLDLSNLEKCAVPVPIRDLIIRCAAKKPEERPPDFPPIIRELERISELGTMSDAVTAPFRTSTENEAPRVATPQPLVSQPVPTPVPPPPSPAIVESATPEKVPTPATPAKMALIAIVGAVIVIGGSLGIFFLKRGGDGGTRQDQAVTDSGKKSDSSKSAPALSGTLATETGEMVLVPAGKFVFGAEATHNRAEIELPAFYIDKTEVTNADWRAFCSATGRPPQAGDPENPVVNITIAEAREFARWANKRIPTAQEWEKAARGVEGRRFPWGEEADKHRANVDSKHVAKALSYVEWPSPFGALNMAGNVWEYVEGANSPSAAAVESWRANKLLKPPATFEEPWVTVRGGSYANPLEYAVLNEWLPIPERAKGPDIGFRCVKDPPR